MRNGRLNKEVFLSHMSKYTSNYWAKQEQPYQDIDKQFQDYLKDGYDETFFKKYKLDPPYLGV